MLQDLGGGLNRQLWIRHAPAVRSPEEFGLGYDLTRQMQHRPSYRVSVPTNQSNPETKGFKGKTSWVSIRAAAA
jgi:hypothetical protein